MRLDRIGSPQHPPAVNARDHNLGCAIETRALAVEQVDGVLAPVGRALFISDPDPAMRIRPPRSAALQTPPCRRP